MMKDTLGIIYTGENDFRLRELTKLRPVAAVPIWGRYRVIDFLLSNMVNSGMLNVGIIAQKNYRSLMDHLGSGKEYDLSRKRDGLFLLPPYVTARNTGGFSGMVDALKCNMDYLSSAPQPFVLLTGSYTLYSTKFNAAMRFHRDNHADVTVLYARAPVERIAAMGDYSTLELDKAHRVRGMENNATTPKSDCVSLGAYILEKSLLQYLVDEACARGETNMDRGILMPKLRDLRVMGYEHTGYVGWVDSVSSYFNISMDVLNCDIRAQMFGEDRPVYTKVRDESPTLYGERAVVQNSLLADGCRVYGEVKNSILFRGVTIQAGAKVYNSVVMQGGSIMPGAYLESVILDKNTIVRENRKLVGQQHYPVVIGKGSVI